jgi:hypothetical protein
MTDWYKYLGIFVYCFIIQVFLLEMVEGLFWFHPYAYLFFLLILPPLIPRWLNILIAFFTGAFFDFFFNTMGIHAAVCLWIGLFKPVFSRPAEKVIPARDEESKLWWNKGGLRFKLIFISGFILFHHTLVFWFEAPDQDLINRFVPTLLGSSFSTFLFIFFSEEFIFRIFKKRQ